MPERFFGRRFGDIVGCLDLKLDLWAKRMDADSRMHRERRGSRERRAAECRSTKLPGRPEKSTGPLILPLDRGEGGGDVR